MSKKARLAKLKRRIWKGYNNGLYGVYSHQEFKRVNWNNDPRFRHNSMTNREALYRACGLDPDSPIMQVRANRYAEHIVINFEMDKLDKVEVIKSPSKDIADVVWTEIAPGVSIQAPESLPILPTLETGPEDYPALKVAKEFFDAGGTRLELVPGQGEVMESDESTESDS